MIHDVDEALRKLVQYALNGCGAEICFDAPTKDWAARRNAPTVNVYLYDVREDLQRRKVAREQIHDEHGIVVGRRRAAAHVQALVPRHGWTQRPEDEHRLLSTILACALRYETLPRDVLPGSLGE